MTNDELRELELRLKQYLDQRDFDELNTLGSKLSRFCSRSLARSQ